jgi:rRNA processing protein Gar1
VELVGKVFGPGPQGELIVHADRPWRYGEGVKIVDRRGRALGRVEGVVGPAAAPYLVVRTVEARDGKGLGLKLKGAEVYIEEAPEAPSQPRGRERRQGRPTGGRQDRRPR